MPSKISKPRPQKKTLPDPLLPTQKIKLAFVVFFTTILLVSAVGVSYRLVRAKSSRVIITNYSAFLEGKYRSEIESSLFNVLLKSATANSTQVSTLFPTGKIRADSFTALTDSGITTATFLVDLDSEHQTYLISYSFLTPGTTSNNASDSSSKSAAASPNLTANSLLISCPSKEKRKYPDSSCVGMYNTSASADTLASIPNDILSALPLTVDSFDFSSRSAIHYEILGHLNGANEFIITINDYSGHNYSSALEKLAELGVSEENYTILYYDLSAPGLR